MKLSQTDMLKAILVLAAVGVSMIMALAFGGFFAARQVARTQLPARAATITLEPVSPGFPLCPGDAIEYSFGATPLRLPLIPRITTTLWSVANGETLTRQLLGDQEVRIWTDPGQIKNDETYVIPMRDHKGRPIPPGEYELRQAIEAEGTAPSTFSLAFTIHNICKGGQPKVSDERPV